MKDQDNTTGSTNDGQPIGTTAGGLSGAATGAAMGAAGGPVGAVIGGIAGAVVGGLTGKGVEKVAQGAVDPAAHDAYWQTNHASQSYAAGGSGSGTGSYEQYRGAYRTGYEGAREHGADKSFAEAETTLKGTYEKAKDATGLGWEQAKHATRAAYERAAEELRVVLHEERLSVGKREVESGAVHVRKTVSTEQVSVPVELRREQATIERIPAGEVRGGVSADAFQEQTIEVRLTAEEAVVAKDTVVTGAVRVRKEGHVETQTVSDSVRKEDVEVERGVESATSTTTGTTVHRSDETKRGV